MVFGSSSKKRPHSLTVVRSFGHKVLDMLELYLDPESYRRLDQFKGKKPTVGLRPMVVFAGTAFESTVANEYTMAKSILTDFFAGERSTGSEKVDVEGLQYVVVLTAEEGSTGATGATGLGDGSKPAIHLRVYLIQTKRSGQRLPRVEVSPDAHRLTLISLIWRALLTLSFFLPPIGRGDGSSDGLPCRSHARAGGGHDEGGP